MNFRPARYFYKQGVLMLAGIALPLLFSVLAIVKVNPFFPFEALPLSFNMGALMIGFTMAYFRRGDIRLVSRRIVVDVLDDPLVVCDEENIIVDINKAFAETVEKKKPLIVGKSLDRIYPILLPYVKEYAGATETKSLILGQSGDNRHFDVQVSPLKDRDGRLIFNIILLRDISAILDANKRVAEYAGALERNNKDLEQFAYIASHDLQEPLRMISNYLGLLEKRYGNALGDTAAEYINFATENAIRMQKMIHSLLDYSRLTPKDSDFEEVAIGEIIESASDNLKGKIDNTNAQINWDPMPAVLGNRVMLTQLFQNLLENALKYHRDVEPKIYIGVLKTDERWEFSVSDNGIGIDPAHSEKIFLFLARLHTDNSAFPGAGVGLSVCKRIVEGHNGRIWVESEPDVGSTFYFTLPG
jgi:signal transduction histidine kinase